MNQYKIEYRRFDMSDSYVGRAFKYARDEKTALSFLGTKPDRNGVLRFKRGGCGKVLSVTVLNDVFN